MVKRFSIATLKVLLGLTLLDSSLKALTLNGKEVKFKNSLEIAPAIETRALSSKYKSEIIKFNSPLTKSQKEHFYNLGVESIVYAGDLSYYFYAKESILNSLDYNRSNFVAKAEMISDYRMKNSGLITLKSSEHIDLNVLFLVELSKKEIENYLLKNGIKATVLRALPSLKEAKIRALTKDLEVIKNLPIIQYMDKSQNISVVNGEVKNSKELRNRTTANSINLSTLWGGEYNLNGENMDIGVVDGGTILKSHQEFSQDGYNRIINVSKDDSNFHATHVGGTIAATGVNPRARGMANRATIYSYSFYDFSFAEAFLELYNRHGILLSNHSYGYSDKIRLGEYGSDAASQDSAVANNPFLNIFQAAGNDGESSGYREFGIIKGPANSKNILTIGALNINSSGVAKLSSKGPVNDGRIKPDLSVRGEYVYSPSNNSNDSYATMSGTSMATPAATGVGALIMQQYKRSTGRFDIRHDLLKAILINTAIDKENIGPDYKVGFGMIDAKAAVDVVKNIRENNSNIIEDTISHNGEKVYNFKVSQNTPFKTTIVWVDEAANPANFKTLVDDIDISLINVETQEIYYPYTLDKNNPNLPAKKDRPNRVDNIEQIEIKNLPKGEYQLRVFGHQIITQNRDFAIASNIDIFKNSNIELSGQSNLKSFAKKIYEEIL